jgi:hypothetical protein
VHVAYKMTKLMSVYNTIANPIESDSFGQGRG